MNPLQISAQFAAYLWFINQPEHSSLPRDEAHRFARLNWEQFLPNADEGLGRLLMAIGNPDEVPEVPGEPGRSRRLAAIAS